MAGGGPIPGVLMNKVLAACRGKAFVAVVARCVPRHTYDRTMPETTTLFRPVGKRELELIQESGFTRFPPRLPHQPIFYPVLNEDYARQIASKWNLCDPQSGYAGYVTKFQVLSNFVDQFPVKQVGDSVHRELWVPAEQLEELNRSIVGKIEVIAEFSPAATPRSAP
jgi:hypothetical protein